MPRMTNDEAIAAEERKLEETKARAQEKIDAAIAKSQARLDELKVKAMERETTQITRLDEQIAAAKLRVEKAQASLASLEAKRAELIGPEQDELPTEVEPSKGKTKSADVNA